MIRVKKVQVPLYPFSFRIVVYDENKEFEDYMREKHPEYELDQPVDSFEAGVIEIGEKPHMVFHNYTKGNKQYPTPGFIAHECKHLTNSIFKHIGQDLDIDNSEAECYLWGWLVDKTHEFLK